jgi:hypothetical protein
MIVERFLHGRRISLLVKDPNEYLQSHWARGEIYEHELYGTGAVRHALGSIVSGVSRRVRGHGASECSVTSKRIIGRNVRRRRRVHRNTPVLRGCMRRTRRQFRAWPELAAHAR